MMNHMEVTLSDASDKVNNWGAFCKEFGISEYACNEGFGHTTVFMNEQQLIQYGIIKGDFNA